MSDLLTVFLILVPIEPLPRTAPPALREALVRIACRLDLSTAQEGWGKTDYAHEIRWTRHTLWQLASTPPSSDSARFPPVGVCDQALEAACSYRSYLVAQQAFYPNRAAFWLDLLAEADRLAEIWSLLRTTQDGSVSIRRQNLLELRERLGSTAYYAGDLPPPVPYWQFTRRD